MIFIDYLNIFWKVVEVKRHPMKPSGRPVIYMFNHLSNCDPWLLIRAMWPIDCKWVCKGSLFKVPFGGWALRNANDIAVRFTADKGGWGTEKGSVRQMMEYSADLLRHQQAIAIFPEGVRNPHPDGPLGEFKDGYFALAIQEKADIVPIAISGTDKLWPRSDWRFDFGNAYISVGSAISVEGHTLESLKEAVFKAITEMREQHPDRKKL